MYSYLFFDLDGTLCESGPGILEAFRYSLDQMGVPFPDVDPNTFIGPPLLELYQRYCGMSYDEANEAIRLYRAYYQRESIYHTPAYKEIRAVLDGLKERGFRLAVATSKPDAMAKKLMGLVGLADCFEEIVGASLDESCHKKGDVIAKALRLLHEPDRADVLMIGDRAEDIRGAKENGLDSCGVLYGYGSRKELEKAGADYIAETPADLFRAAEGTREKGTFSEHDL